MADKADKHKQTKLDSSVAGMLAKLWRLIIFDGNLHKLLKFYLDKYSNRGGKRSRSTILGYFTAGGMTWKTFMFLIFEILPVKRMSITIELTMVNDEKIVETTSITSDEIFSMDDEEADTFTKVFEKERKKDNFDAPKIIKAKDLEHVKKRNLKHK